MPETIRSHLIDPIPSLADARPNLSIAAVLQPVIDRSLAKRAMARFPDAASMLAALEAIDAVSRAAAASDRRTAAPNWPLSRAQRIRAAIAHSWRAAVGLVTLADAFLTHPGGRVVPLKVTSARQQR